MTADLRVVALVFPDVTQLDVTGPVQVLARMPGAVVDLAWHRIEPVRTDAGFDVMPTITYEAAPQADVLLVPGGNGVDTLIGDERAVSFVRAQAAGARYVTSVCTGAFVLGVAGLLRGRRATTHWASHDMLALFGAIPTVGRVVRDGKLITGAGVTSGIDFGLVVAAELCGVDVARKIQLMIEYDPQPPFDAGSPDAPETDRAFASRVAARNHELREELFRAAAHEQ